MYLWWVLHPPGANQLVSLSSQCTLATFCFSLSVHHHHICNTYNTITSEHKELLSPVNFTSEHNEWLSLVNFTSEHNEWLSLVNFTSEHNEWLSLVNLRHKDTINPQSYQDTFKHKKYNGDIPRTDRQTPDKVIPMCRYASHKQIS